MRYKSTEGMWFNSLVTAACDACLKDEDDDSSREQDVNQEAPVVSGVPKKKKRVKVCVMETRTFSALMHFVGTVMCQKLLKGREDLGESSPTE
ncbi:hypothetical protein Bca52824_009762 [Brassica carinata]|uniref:Uncharacterized protein n=1 Tax=Brassica carinata TaxID=52824 RepID=A0A8X7WCB1_BRACI|nr:hypothetical protein Bca52824_009762 [Brassica carinata]